MVERRHLHFALAFMGLAAGVGVIAFATGRNQAASRPEGGHQLASKSLSSPEPDPSASNVTEAVARRFAGVYLHYERGEFDANMRVALSRLCVEPFRSELLAQPARVPPAANPPPQRVRQALAPSPTLIAGAAGMAVPVILEGPNAGKSRLVVDLRFTARGWRVEGIER